MIGLSRHRAGLPAYLGTAVNKVKGLPYNSPPRHIVIPTKDHPCLRGPASSSDKGCSHQNEQHLEPLFLFLSWHSAKRGWSMINLTMVSLQTPIWWSIVLRPTAFSTSFEFGYICILSGFCMGCMPAIHQAALIWIWNPSRLFKLTGDSFLVSLLNSGTACKVQETHAQLLRAFFRFDCMAWELLSSYANNRPRYLNTSTLARSYL